MNRKQFNEDTSLMTEGFASRLLRRIEAEERALSQAGILIYEEIEQ